MAKRIPSVNLNLTHMVMMNNAGVTTVDGLIGSAVKATEQLTAMVNASTVMAPASNGKAPANTRKAAKASTARKTASKTGGKKKTSSKAKA